MNFLLVTTAVTAATQPVLWNNGHSAAVFCEEALPEELLQNRAAEDSATPAPLQILARSPGLLTAARTAIEHIIAGSLKNRNAPKPRSTIPIDAPTLECPSPAWRVGRGRKLLFLPLAPRPRPPIALNPKP